jgi:plastocyanin
VLLVAALPGLSSCGSQPGAPPHTTHTVSLEGVSFQPADLTVNVGDTVVWVNKDPFPHTATASGAHFDSKEIPAEKSWTYTPTAAGEFPYVCTYHPTMKGMLRVK